MAITSSQSWKTDFMSNYEDVRRVASGHGGKYNPTRRVGMYMDHRGFSGP